MARGLEAGQKDTGRDRDLPFVRFSTLPCVFNSSLVFIFMYLCFFLYLFLPQKQTLRSWSCYLSIRGEWEGHCALRERSLVTITALTPFVSHASLLFLLHLAFQVPNHFPFFGTGSCPPLQGAPCTLLTAAICPAPTFLLPESGGHL